jgi:hypothetical protein
VRLAQVVSPKASLAMEKSSVTREELVSVRRKVIPETISILPPGTAAALESAYDNNVSREKLMRDLIEAKDQLRSTHKVIEALEFEKKVLSDKLQLAGKTPPDARPLLGSEAIPALAVADWEEKVRVLTAQVV